jgi:hypothetical protein
MNKLGSSIHITLLIIYLYVTLYLLATYNVNLKEVRAERAQGSGAFPQENMPQNERNPFPGAGLDSLVSVLPPTRPPGTLKAFVRFRVTLT